MMSFGSHEYVIILGDLNAQFPRNKTELTGRWTTSAQGDSGNAPEVMGEFDMIAASTVFQPKENTTVVTWHRPSLDAISLGNQGGYQPRCRAWRSKPKYSWIMFCADDGGSLASPPRKWTGLRPFRRTEQSGITHL